MYLWCCPHGFIHQDQITLVEADRRILWSRQLSHHAGFGVHIDDEGGIGTQASFCGNKWQDIIGQSAIAPCADSVTPGLIQAIGNRIGNSGVMDELPPTGCCRW